MNELIYRISSYNIFNYILPGVIYCVFLSEFSKWSLIQDDFVTGFFLYYFIGLVISRIGSLIIEPLFRKLEFLKFAKYSEFIEASQNDSKLETLSESNNTYRTLTSLFMVLIFSKLYLMLSDKIEWLRGIEEYILFIGLALTFILSYLKQTNFITRRILYHKKSKP